MSVKWQASSPQKHRLRWTGELEQFFNDAVEKLGGIIVATPQAVVDILKKKYPEITTSHVKSHLQHIRNKKIAQNKRKHSFYYKTDTVLIGPTTASHKDNDRLHDIFIAKDPQQALEDQNLVQEYQKQKATQRKKFVYEKLKTCQNVDQNDKVVIEELKQSVKQIIDDFVKCIPAIKDPIFERYQEQLVKIQPHHPLKLEIQELTKIYIFCTAHIFKDHVKETQQRDVIQSNLYKDGDMLDVGQHYKKRQPAVNYTDSRTPADKTIVRQISNCLYDNMPPTYCCEQSFKMHHNTPIPLSASAPAGIEYQQSGVNDIQNIDQQKLQFQKFLSKEQQNQQCNNFEDCEKQSDECMFNKINKSGGCDVLESQSKDSVQLSDIFTKRRKFSSCSTSMGNSTLDSDCKECEVQETKQQQEKKVSSSSIRMQQQFSNGNTVSQWNQFQSMIIENPSNFARFNPSSEEDFNRCVQT